MTSAHIELAIDRLHDAHLRGDCEAVTLEALRIAELASAGYLSQPDRDKISDIAARLERMEEEFSFLQEVKADEKAGR